MCIVAACLIKVVVFCFRGLLEVQGRLSRVVRQLSGAAERARLDAGRRRTRPAAADGAALAEDIGAALAPAPSQLRQPVVGRQQFHRQLRYRRPVRQFARYAPPPSQCYLLIGLTPGHVTVRRSQSQRDRAELEVLHQ